MALQKANRTSDTQAFKFENGGDTLKGFYLKTSEEVINGSKVKKHVFRTSDGLFSVLGQADMYSQLTENHCVGTYVEVTFTGKFRKLKGGKTMKLYDVSFDREQVSDEAPIEDNSYDQDDNEQDLSAETEVAEIVDEPTPPRPSKPLRAAAVPDAARQAKVQALLNSNRNK